MRKTRSRAASCGFAPSRLRGQHQREPSLQRPRKRRDDHVGPVRLERVEGARSAGTPLLSCASMFSWLQRPLASRTTCSHVISRSLVT